MNEHRTETETAATDNGSDAAIRTTIVQDPPDDLPFDDGAMYDRLPPPPCSALDLDGARCQNIADRIDPLTALPVCASCATPADLVRSIHSLVQTVCPDRKTLIVTHAAETYTLRRSGQRWAVYRHRRPDAEQPVCLMDTLYHALSWKSAMVIKDVCEKALRHNIGGN